MPKSGFSFKSKHKVIEKTSVKAESHFIKRELRKNPKSKIHAAKAHKIVKMRFNVKDKYL